MKKRLALICIMLLSVFSFFACKDDPYEKLTIQAFVEVDGKAQELSAIDILIKDEGLPNAPNYKIEPYTFNLVINGYKGDCPDVQITGGEGVISTSAKFISSNEVAVTITPLDPEKTDPFILNARTTEGNKSLDIDVKIDLQINNFTFNDTNLKVVAKGGQIDLNDLTKYINFTPEYTSQKNIKFEIATPVDNEIPNHSGNYIYDGETPYAEIVDGVLTAFDKTSDGRAVVYPLKVPSITEEDSYQCITIKASYIGDNASEVKISDKYIDIEVVEDCSDIKLYMNYEKNTNIESSDVEGAFSLNKNDKGEYDIVLLDPQYKYNKHFPTYYIERDILFNFGQGTVGYDPNDYVVKTEQVLNTDKKPITLTRVQGENVENNQFNIVAEGAGDYSHVFRIEHKDYPDIINEEVVVNFHVKDLPANVLINDEELKTSYTVYDEYAKNLAGAKFTVDLNNNNGDFKYFVFLLDSTQSEFIHLYRGGNNPEPQTKGVIKNMSGKDVVVSSEEGKEMAYFSSMETFYLKHTFTTLPNIENPVAFGIGIEFSVAADSYTDEIKEYYFDTNCVIPVVALLNIEKSIKDISFTQSNYMVDLTNPALNNGKKDEAGIKLFELEEGHTRDSVFSSYGISYNENLIDVYDIEVDGITTFYMKGNSNYTTGKTDIVVKTKNGIEKVVSVQTFIPTVYSKLNDEGKTLPMSIWVDKNKVLYAITDMDRGDETGKEDHEELYQLYKKDSEGNVNVWDRSTTYTSLHSLFLLKGTTTEIRFYDYVLTYDEKGNEDVIAIDITSLVKVDFNYKNYASYANGIITAKSSTEHIEQDPLKMMLTYTAGYIEIDEEGNEKYTLVTKTQIIDLYIYIPLQGVNVETEKDVTIYVDDSLGIESKNLSYSTTMSDFIPKEDKLGVYWNTNDIWEGETTFEKLPVSLFYRYNLDYSVLVDNKEIKIPSFSGAYSYTLKYSDIFKDVSNEEEYYIKEKQPYVLVIKSVVSENLKKWLLSSEINGGGGYTEDDIDFIIKNYIFNNEIELKINVYIRQFFKLQNINEISVKAEYASRVTNYTLGVSDDGVYFENRGINSDMTATIPYTINSGIDAPDKTFEVLNSANAIFSAEVSQGLSKNDGIITIVGLNTFGEEYLRITPRDNIKSKDANGEYTFFDSNLVQSFRVKIANGSIEAPFEIRSATDFENMQADIDRGNYYHYKVTRNINLANVDIKSVVFNSTSSNFSLSGKHSYYRNNREYVSFCSLYNMTIKKDLTDFTSQKDLTGFYKDINIGLFGVLNSKVTISNFNILNANINLTIDNLGGDASLNVGILAGSANGAKITNSAINGTIKITTLSNASTNVLVGGMFGAIDNDTTISGLPGTFVSGLNSTAHNVNVLLNIEGNNNQKVVAGGIVGNSNGAISDMSIVSTIKANNVVNSSIGGITGSAIHNISNVKVYPKIVVDGTSTNNIIGGAIGEGNGVFDHLTVYFTKDVRISSWKDNCGIYVGENTTAQVVGGLIGKTLGGTLSYSYLRSFHDTLLTTFKSNIYVLSKDVNSVVGGVVGDVSALTMTSTYFDGDITANNKGLLFGKLNSVTKVENCYGIGGLYEINGNTAIKKEDILGKNIGLIANVVFVESDNYIKDIVNFTNVYGVMNGSLLYVIDNNNNKLNLTTLSAASITALLNNSSFDIKTKLENLTDTTKWIWEDGINKVGLFSLPILMDNRKSENSEYNRALYDVLPESIVVDRIEDIYGLFQLSDIGGKKVQLLMYVNRQVISDNNYNVRDDYYEISIKNDGVINIKLNGGAVVFSTILEINSDLVITEEGLGNDEVIVLDGWKLYPKNPGISIVTIASALDNSVELELEIKVVDGLTGLDVYNSQISTPIKCDKFEEATNLSNTIYVDEETLFTINNNNVLDGTSYNASRTMYKLVIQSADAGVNVDDILININEKSYKAGDTLILYNNTFVLSGVKNNNVFIDITPGILLDGIENSKEFYLLENLTTRYKFNSCYKTKSISVSDKIEGLSYQVSSEFSITMDSYLDEILLIKIGNRTYEISLRDIINGDSSLESYAIDYELVNIKFESLIVEDSIFPNLYNITLNAIAKLDIEYYRQNAEKYNLNTLKYVFNLIPASNYISGVVIDHKIADYLEISVDPVELKTVTINYYPKGETLSNQLDGSFNPATENESTLIVPGRYGLLKLTLEEEFTDSSYITITLDEKYADYVEIWQVAGNIMSEKENAGSEENDYFSYSEIASTKIYKPTANGREYGLKLSKLSLNYLDTTYFNKTYYIKVYMARDYALLDADDVVFNITSYTQTTTELISKDIASKTLTISELPSISVKVDGLSSANLGIGTKKPLDIVVKGSQITTIDIVQKEGLLILDDNNQIVNTLDVAYINDKRKYYVYANTGYDYENYEIEFKSIQKVHGILENASSKVNINVVDFEIDRIELNGSVDKLVTIKHGGEYIISVDIIHKPLVVVGNNIDAINQLKLEIQSKIDNEIELSMVGCMIDSDLSGKIDLRYLTYENGKINYKPVAQDTDLRYVALREASFNNIRYYVLKGIAVNNIDNTVKLRLVMPYAYENGILQHKETIEGNSFEADFEILVEDSSTYDNPMPIETQEQLETALKTAPSTDENANYILLNNITLKNWVPVKEAVCTAIDGNGYKITIESFNLAGFKGQDKANIGICQSISENTLFKNLIVDISPLLVDEATMLREVETLKNSNINNYNYDSNINLAYIKEINFGIIAGVNKGSITNAKIISTGSENGSYLHVLSSLGYVDKKFVTTNIGGIVGLNEASGAITNSYIGLDANKMEEVNGVYHSNIAYVKSPSSAKENNEGDKINHNIKTYSFTIAGGNVLGGLVAINGGTISNSYVKGLGLYNTYFAVEDGKTGGFVAVNNNVISGAFVESAWMDANYRALEDDFVVESIGHIGGFVYENTSLVENAYSNVFLVNKSSFIGGFVYNNSGTIKNAYTTTINRNNLAHGQFTGVSPIDNKENDDDTNYVATSILNSGTYINAYYIVLDGEQINKNEDAKPIEHENSPVDEKITWQGFSFASSKDAEDGIWYVEKGKTPKIVSTMTDTLSFRILESINDVAGKTQPVYNYSYEGNALGSKNNPLVISSADMFAKMIIRNGVTINGVRVFGAERNSDSILAKMNNVQYVRLVNHLNFANKPIAPVKLNDDVLGSPEYVLYETVFAGILDGNGMSINRLNISVNSITYNADNFGLFSQIGYCINGQDLSQAVIKNLNINIETYNDATISTIDNIGILAGTIVNSNIINVHVDGGNLKISGNRTAGGLAGIIKAEGGKSITLQDVTVTNINVEASSTSLGGDIFDKSAGNLGAIYKEFTIKNSQSTMSTTASFKSLYVDGETKLSDAYINSVCYAGGVAGVILANNYNSSIINTDSDYYDYKSGIDVANVGDGKSLMPTQSSINNVTYEGSLKIEYSDNAGGLFGYVGENTIIKNSKLVLSNNQSIKANNFAGGLVGENHGVIDECTVAFDKETQIEMDKNILLNDRKHTEYYLFDARDYTVSIGGIAGYSSNGVIIDSYAKVNVIKDNAFVAGGVVGYTEDYNYLGYTYTTGAVLGKEVIGGLVGMQVNGNNKLEDGKYKLDETKTLKMYNVVSLTDFGATLHNVGDTITRKLYNNQKDLYEGEFTLRIPEIGNQQISNDGTYDETDKVWKNQKYNNKTKVYVIGSVVGSLKTVTGETTIKYDTFADISTIKNTDSKVYSTTLGIYDKDEKSISQRRQDSYTTTPYNFVDDAGNTHNLYSFDVAYKNENYYFEQIFTSQDYVQSLLGQYYYLEGNTTKHDSNIFMKNDDDSNTSFATNTIVWMIENNLPEFSKGLYSSIEKITTANEWKKAVTSSSGGKTYNIEPETDNKIDISSQIATPIMYPKTIKDTYQGVLTEDGIKPTITLTTTNIGSIFNSISGATLTNIIFDINASSIDLDGTTTQIYGLFANIIENSVVENCTFNITLSNSINIDKNAVGLLFGEMRNTIFKNNTVNFVINNAITLGDNSNVNNFGLLASSTNNCTIIANEIACQNINITTSSASNIGGLVGILNNSSLKDITFETDITLTDSGTNSINFGGFVGSSNNSTISELTANNVSYTLNSNKDNANISNIVGSAYATNISDTNSEKSLTITSTTQTNSISAGAIVGLVEGSVTIDNVYSLGNISVTASSEKLSVGGIVGASSSLTLMTAYSNGNITVTNNYAGAYTTDEGKEIINSYAESNVGGLVGATSGYSLIQDVYSIAKLDLDIQDDISVRGRLGGLVGYSSGNIEFARFVALNDFVCHNVTKSNVYVSGVVGLNKGLFTGEYGYSYVELPKNTGIITASITNNSISSNTSNVYYAQEFVGSDYTSDRNFTSFAMADIYDTISEDSSINNLVKVLTANTYGGVKILLPTNISTTLGSKSIEVGSSRFNPNVGITDIKDYNVILNDTAMSLGRLEKVVISGRSTKNGKVVVTFGGDYSSTGLKHLVVASDSNSVLSNLYVDYNRVINDKNNSTYVAFIGSNEGLITNVYVYGLTTNNYPIAIINNGRIYQSATSVVYEANPIDDALYGLVKTNLGVISDCYSSSFGYSSSRQYKTNVYGFAFENAGTISNSFYFVNDWMIEDNTLKGFVEHNEANGYKGKVTNCYQDANPRFVSYSSGVWTTENGHAQIRGMKDIDNQIDVELSLAEITKTLSNHSSYIQRLTEEADDALLTAWFDYEIKFYSTSHSGYNYIRINDGKKFAEYINGLKNGLIPAKTIIIIGNSFEVTSDIQTFSLSQDSAIIGVRYYEAKASQWVNIPEINFKNRVRNTAIIDVNNGLICGLLFSGLSFENNDPYYSSFAPINKNTGIMYNFTMFNTISDRSEMTIGLLKENTGYMYNVKNSSGLYVRKLYYGTCPYNKLGNAYEVYWTSLSVNGEVVIE